MDEFEKYLLEKINYYQDIKTDSEKRDFKEGVFLGENVVTELMEVLSKYTLNHKCF